MLNNDQNNHVLINSFEQTSEFFRANNGNRSTISKIIITEKNELDYQMNLLKSGIIDNSFNRSDYNDVFSFLHEASKDYDSDLVNPYWAFSHDILKFLLTKFITEHFDDTRTVRVFDAGAGTGNWSKFVIGLGSSIRGIMFDMNVHMLKVAKPKLAQVSNSVRIVEGNLENLKEFPSQQSNLLLCMHNVIGLARNTKIILHNLYEYLEYDGLAFIMGMNKYHSFNFTRQFREEEEILRIVRDGTVKFKADMPEMFCYTPEEFKALMHEAGFQEVTILGFPVTTYPSMKDTKLLRTDTSVTQLKDSKVRAKLLSLEKKLCLYPELAYRGGSSLIAICKKKLI